jgi:hypothetical protein
VALEWVGEDNEHDNRGTTDCSGNSRGIHANNVATDFVSEREVACNGDQDIGCSGATGAREDNGRCAEVAIILYFVEDGEHLEENVSISTFQWPEKQGIQETYILMASKCEDNNWKAAQGRNCASPVNYANWAAICRCVTLDKVVDNQDNQVGHGD